MCIVAESFRTKLVHMDRHKAREEMQDTRTSRFNDIYGVLRLAGYRYLLH